MCIINREVIQVMATGILVLKSQLGDRQLTVYSNKVATKSENEMILPFPLRFLPGGKDEVQFHDVSDVRCKRFVWGSQTTILYTSKI